MKLKTIDGYVPLMKYGSNYSELINVADTSNPTPHQSGYHVHTSVMLTNGKFYSGGNHEFGICDAIHGEESAITKAIGEHPKEKVQLMGFGKGAAEIVSHCGNCRDTILQYAAPDMETVSGNSLEALIVPFHKTYTRENFDKINQTDLSFFEKMSFDRLVLALENSYNVYVRPENRHQLYSAAIITKAKTYFGSYEGDVAYDPTLAIRAAALTLKNSHADDNTRFDVRSLVVVSRNTPHVHVLYKDRQQFMEFAESLCIAESIPVKLITIGDNNHVLDVYSTNHKEWLPHPFAPSVLGIKDELKEYFDRLKRR